MKKQNYLLIALLSVFLLLGIGLSYYTFNKKIPITEVRDSLFSLFLKNNSDTFKESTDWYETSISYPKDNQKVRDEIFKIWTAFATENELKKFKTFDEAKQALQLNAEGSKYAFSADYKIVHSQNTISYVYEIYTFTGGAHGSTDIHPITLNDKLEFLSVDRILPDDQLSKVSALCYDDLLKQKKERLKESGMSDKDIADMMKDNSWLMEGTNPTRDNYSNAWYDGDDLVVSFGQYQVGSYAEGIYEVKIPRSKI